MNPLYSPVIYSLFINPFFFESLNMILRLFLFFTVLPVMILFTSCSDQITEEPLVIIHSISDTLRSDGTLKVVFKTFEPALGLVEFSDDRKNLIYAYTAGKRYDTLHSVVLFHLKPQHSYYYRIRAKNSQGQMVSSGWAGITTQNVSYAPPVFQLHMIQIPDPGDCFYIVFPNQKKMLYDAGYSGAVSSIVNYLTAVGCDTLHYAVATHAHADHYGGYQENALLSRFPIQRFFKPRSLYEETYNSVISRIQNANPSLTVTVLERGNSSGNTSSLAIDPRVTITVLSAGAYDLTIDAGNSGGSPKSNVNNESLTMLFKTGQASFLLSGDLEQEAYRAYIQTNPVVNPRVDILKASHHLRIDGINAGVLTATNPIIILASTDSEGGCSGIMHCSALETALSSRADLFRMDAADPVQNFIKKERAHAPGNVVIETDGITIQVRKN